MHNIQVLPVLNQITALQLGNEEAFVEVYHQFHVKLFRYFVKRIQSHDIAKDLTQQTFIKLWQSRHSLSLLHSIDTQCFTIANSILIDHLRKQASEKKHRSRLQQTNSHNLLSACHSLKDFESSDFLKAAAANLPPVRKVVFMLKIEKGYSNREIAEELSISVKTVEDHYSKAIKQIRTVALTIETGLLFICCLIY